MTEAALTLVERSLAHRQAGMVIGDLVEDRQHLQTKMVGVMTSLLTDLGRRVSSRSEHLLNHSRFAEVRLKPSLNKADVASLIEDILVASELREWAGTRLTPTFWAHHAQVVARTSKLLMRAGLVENATQATINRLLQDGGRRAGLVDIQGDTRLAILRAIEHGSEAGLSPRETARLMRDIVPEGRFVHAGAGYRAQLIARTETLHAQRAASLARYRANRVRMVVAYDGDSDATCLMRNGSEYTLQEAEDEMLNTHPQCVLAFGPLSGV